MAPVMHAWMTAFPDLDSLILSYSRYILPAFVAQIDCKAGMFSLEHSATADFLKDSTESSSENWAAYEKLMANRAKAPVAIFSSRPNENIVKPY